MCVYCIEIYKTRIKRKIISISDNCNKNKKKGIVRKGFLPAKLVTGIYITQRYEKFSISIHKNILNTIKYTLYFIRIFIEASYHKENKKRELIGKKEEEKEITMWIK